MNHRQESKTWLRSNLLTFLSLPVLSLSFASVGFAQEVSPNSIQTDDIPTIEESISEVNTSRQASDLVEGETPFVSSSDTLFAEADPVFLPIHASIPAAIHSPDQSASLTTAEISELKSLQEGVIRESAIQNSAIAQSPTNPPSPDQIPQNPSADLPIDSASPEQPASSNFDPNASLRIPPNLGEGRTVERVYTYITNPTGDTEQDAALREEIEQAFAIQAGGSFSPLFADRAVREVQQLPFVESAEYRLYESNLPGTVIVALLVTTQPEETRPPETTQQPRGIFVTGNFGDFPTLYESDRALFKFVLNGSMGLFSDSHPWFGNPESFVFRDYQPNGTITWGEYSLEAGFAGITQLGNLPLYAYGAATYLISSTIQPDIFTEDDRFFGAIEQLYGGLLVAERGNPTSFNLSFGRQKFQLNQGFLFSQFSGAVNAQDRGGSFLNPRTAYEMTVVADARFGDFRLRGFFLEPNLLSVQPITQYLGANLSYNNRNLEVSLAYVTIPNSESVYVLPGGITEPREGLQVINPRIRLNSLFGVEGLWVTGEYAYQFSDRFDMSAHGAYVWLGYTANNSPWRPTFEYRFAGLSGDNPNTAAYERFDPLQAGGLSDWLQGLNLGKVFNNSNSFSHRLAVSVQPTELLSLSLVYYYRYADQLNNLGGSPSLQTLRSRDLGHEIQLLTRYSLSQNLLLQFLSSVAFPGVAIQRAVPGETDSWFTIQLSAYMFF